MSSKAKAARAASKRDPAYTFKPGEERQKRIERFRGKLIAEGKEAGTLNDIFCILIDAGLESETLNA